MTLFHERIASYAVEFPMKAAAEDARGIMTYGELAEQSARIQSLLAALGFRAGDAGAVCVPYGKEIILGAVSILRAGGVFVPFDDAYPTKRMEFMLSDCEAKVLLTVHAIWEQKKLAFPEDHVIFLDDPSLPEATTLPCPTLSESSPALLLYTSGTTGTPKGVLHSHSFLLHLADWMNVHDGAEMNSDTRTGIMSSFSFVGTQMFLMGPLSKGGTVCIAPDETRKDLGFLYQFLLKARITHIFLPSSVAASMAEDYDIRGIRIFAAGEKLRFFRAHTPGNCLINSYGCTETSGVLSKKVFGNEEVITVGKPYSNTRIRIVNEAMQPVEPGEAGDLLVSSDFMARQYYKLPEVSGEKWMEMDGSLWFCTGDRARQTAEGDCVLLGRTDNTIKLRGFRIETGEVEAQIASAVARRHDSIGQCVVVKKTLSGTEHLCCYYEAEEDLDEAAVSREISQYLAEYMVPDTWIRMDTMPRNANGKVMKNELPWPVLARKTLTALDNEVVARMVWTACDVLDIRELISPDDSFTSLGGTSLSAMAFVSRLREQGIRVNSTQVLRSDSLRHLAGEADVIWEQLWTPNEYEIVQNSFHARGEHIQKVLPIANWQDEMLFDQLLHPDWSHFRNVVLFQLDSRVSRDHLREALDILAAENEELRSSIVYHDVTVVQQVICDRKIPLEIIEDETIGSRELAEMNSRLLYSPIDLQYDSLMQVVAVHTGTETQLFVLTHRIAFGQEKRRALLARLMKLLKDRYPDDVSISEWVNMLEHGLISDKPEKLPEKGRKTDTATVAPSPSEICVYSENAGPKLVFIHTGNTGSAAYYQLAARIKNQVSFAVIEPFNLYHPDQARYGIPQIAAKYIEILKKYQPEGPYYLGGWCYGGVVAHEMACQLEQAGEKVQHLFMLDAHAMGNRTLVRLSGAMHAEINREYFETCPLFAELRANGMLDAMVSNAAHVSADLMSHTPALYHGAVTYFKPRQIPAAVSEQSRRYWETMMRFSAGNYEHYCLKDHMRIIITPHEHDLMMDKASLDIIVPELLRSLQISDALA